MAHVRQLRPDRIDQKQEDQPWLLVLDKYEVSAIVQSLGDEEDAWCKYAESTSYEDEMKELNSLARAMIYQVSDQAPRIRVKAALFAADRVWSDEDWDNYWWSPADHSDQMHSPIFHSPTEAMDWIKLVRPRIKLHAFMHLGRGIMAAGAYWDPVSNEVQMRLGTAISDTELEERG